MTTKATNTESQKSYASATISKTKKSQVEIMGSISESVLNSNH